MARPIRGVLTLLALLSVATPANAASSWAGSWRLADAQADATARDKAIEAATADLSRFKRGTARSRLGEKLASPRKLVLKLNGDVVSIVRDGKPTKLAADGSTKTVETAGGQGSAKAEIKGSQLVITAAGGNGTRTTVYERQGDALVVTVEHTSKRPPRPNRIV
ncbi:MAG: hypothetical protein AAFQ82_03080 [Myxococcota bacterium]